MLMEVPVSDRGASVSHFTSFSSSTCTVRGASGSSNARKRLSLKRNSHKGALSSPQNTLIYKKSPISTRSNRNDAIIRLLNGKVTFLKSVKNLNPFNKSLLKSVEEDKENDIMTTKKWKSQNAVMKKDQISDGFSQRTLLSYFKSHDLLLNTSNCNTAVNKTNKNIAPRISNADSKIVSNSMLKKDNNNSQNREKAEIYIDLCSKSSSSSCEDNCKNDKQKYTDVSSAESTPLIQSGIVEASQNVSTSVTLRDVNTMIPKSSSDSNSFNIFTELKSVDKSSTTVSSCNYSSNSLSTFNSGRKTRTFKPCAPYKIVKGTPFAVDAFNYGLLPDVQVYFLTHFHSDHYIGLNKSFSKPIYCTKITAELCLQKLRVRSDIINILEVDTTVDICGIQVTTVDANHCPGAVMLVFSLPSGKNILHCGDFRATSLMESYPIFWNKEMHTVYLDTTYCSPRYDFPTQSESIARAVSILQDKKKFMEANGKSFNRLLIVCGTYSVGKEKFFMGIAKELELDVWAPAEKNTVLKVALGQNFNLKTPLECQIHVLPMGKIQYNALDIYLQTVASKFDEIVAFKPSGWELSKSSLIQRGNITIYGIPYSEHSSFSELQRFIKFLRPQHIIPTVPGKGDSKTMQKYFSCWVGDTEQKAQKRGTTATPRRYYKQCNTYLDLFRTFVLQ